MSTIRKKIAHGISALCLAGGILTSSAHAQPNQVSTVVFKPLNDKATEGQIVNQLYAPFIKRHPNVKMETAVVDLSNDKVGSIFVKFNGDRLCDMRGCLVTLLKYNSGQWSEQFSQHSNDILVSSNPEYALLGVKGFYTSNGLLWMWTPEGNRFFPSIWSVGAPLKANRLATFNQNEFAKKKHPEYFIPGSDVRVFEMSSKLDGITDSHFLIYQGAMTCGQVGCPFILASGDDNGGYVAKADGIMDTYVTVFDGGNKSGMKNFVVQVGSGLEFYQYNHGKYTSYMTTYPSSVTEAP